MDNDIINRVRRDLAAGADEQTRTAFHRYFKESVTAYGVKTALVSRIGRKYFQEIRQCTKNEIFFLCEELFSSGFSEEAFIASEWSYAVHSQYQLGDFTTFDRWVALYIDNWAKCDTFCNHAVGTLVEMYPVLSGKLVIWARSPNRWLRRAAAVTLILPARKGMFLQEIFEIAGILLLDDDDLVQKGYGWMLKEASKTHQTEVFNYILKNKRVMPRTALRYAIEKMPVGMKAQAMAK